MAKRKMLSSDVVGNPVEPIATFVDVGVNGQDSPKEYRRYRVVCPGVAVVELDSWSSLAAIRAAIQLGFIDAEFASSCSASIV